MNGLMLKSYAKVNLGLYMTDKRPNGYHELSSIFLPIGLHDVMVFNHSDTFNIECTGPFASECPTDNTNTIYKVYELFVKQFNVNTGVSIKIEKNIPPCAGLGGGSSNAATAISAFSTLFQIGLRKDEKIQLASRIGADVPFFIDNKPAYVEGIGEIITPFELKKDYYIALMKPKKGLSTALVYKNFNFDLTLKNCNVKYREQLKRLAFQGLITTEKLGSLSNDLEKVSVEMLPEVAEARIWLEFMRPVVCMMSGSGSSVYALFETREDIDKVIAKSGDWFFCKTTVMR